MTVTDSVDRLLDDFVDWLNATHDPATDPDIDVDVVDALLRTRRDYAGHDDPDAWDPGHVTELLLEVLPRKVTLAGGMIERTVPSLSAYLHFLAAQDRLRPAGILPVLLGELETVASDYPRAMADPSRFGPAKRIASLMAADGVDVRDEAAVAAWIDNFNERLVEERPRLFNTAAGHPMTVEPEPEPEPVVLRPIELAAEAELRRAAAEAPLLLRSRGLLDFLGRGRPITAAGNLRLADAKALVDLLGTGDVVDPPFRGDAVRTRSSADLPGVDAVWQLATHAELVQRSATRAYAAVTGGWVAAHPVEAVTRLADAAVELGVGLGRDLGYAWRVVEEVDGFLPLALMALYDRAEPVPVAALVGFLAGEPEPPREGAVLEQVWSDVGSRWLQVAWARLAELGMVERLGVCADPVRPATGVEATRATSVALTPLGYRWLQRTLPAHGLAVTPLLSDLAARSARDLLSVCSGLDVDGADSAMAVWLAERAPAAAAADVLVVMRDGELEDRQLGMLLLDRIGEDAEPSVRQALDEPRLRPYARIWLASRGLVEPPTVTDRDTSAFFVEGAAMLLRGAGPEAVAARLSDLGDVAQQEQLAGSLWRLDSPHTDAVLAAIAQHHDVKVVRRAARRASHKLRSASDGRCR